MQTKTNIPELLKNVRVLRKLSFISNICLLNDFRDISKVKLYTKVLIIMRLIDGILNIYTIVSF